MQIQKLASEIEDDYSNDDLLGIKSWGADLSFRELITMYNNEELVKPEIQRNYVWDRKEASGFIDSLLLGLPVPSIFLARTSDERKLIVDGYQRIMTVFDYVDKKLFSGDSKIFKLFNSEKINPKWRGKAFDELEPTYQRRIVGTTIHAIVFDAVQRDGRDTALYQVFERINSTGRILQPQEIRNCVYQGPLNALLIKLNKAPVWRKLYGEETADARMQDVELILRFLALANTVESLQGRQISLKKHLNEYMGDKSNNTSIHIDQLEEQFIDTMKAIHDYLGDDAFRNVSPTGETIRRFHPTIFDSISIATSRAIRKHSIYHVVDIQSRRLALLQNTEYRTFISQKTTNVDHIRGRINAAFNTLFGGTNAE